MDHPSDFEPAITWLKNLDLEYLGRPIHPLHVLGWLASTLAAHRDLLVCSLIPGIKDAAQRAHLVQAIQFAEALAGLRLDCEDPKKCPLAGELPHHILAPGLANIAPLCFADVLSAIAAAVYETRHPFTQYARNLGDPFQAAQIAALIHAAVQVYRADGRAGNDPEPDAAAIEALAFADEMFAKWADHWTRDPGAANTRCHLNYMDPAKRLPCPEPTTPLQRPGKSTARARAAKAATLDNHVAAIRSGKKGAK